VKTAKDSLIDENMFHSRDVDERIAHLRAKLVPGGAESNPDYYDEAEELVMLQELRRNVGEYAWQQGVSFVSDHYWERYADDQAADQYGRAVVETVYWNDDLFADDLQDDYQHVDFNGTTYHYEE
jgi:hypothetical protein